MAKAVIDLTGRRFGRLTVVGRNHGTNTTSWVCLCDCGNEHIATTKHLSSGQTKSCGCLNREPKNMRHGASRTRLYGIYHSMLQRCYNKNDSGHYPHYGGRGIAVCNEWRNSFEAFRDWALANGYSDNLSIDRVDVDGNYCPENCRWADCTVQQRNKTNTKKITHDGATKTLYEWSEITGISPEIIRDRIRHGWDTDRALTQKVRK